MELSPRKINLFLLIKLPSAFLAGVRVESISETTCVTRVRHSWINQNPFKSMFWAVQGMAAELSTGTMMMVEIKESGQKISMLLASNKATFYKKARGKITFTCNDRKLIKEAIMYTVSNSEGQTLWMTSEGRDSSGDVVSPFEFEWTIKVKS